MTTTPSPPSTKTVRVQAATHARLGALADSLNGNVDDAIRFLMDPTVLRIRISPEMRQRWEASARGAGMDLTAFVLARVEAAIQYGTDKGTVELMYQHIREIRNMLRAGVVPEADRGPRE